MSNQIVQFKNEQDLKQVLATQYMKQIENLLGDKDTALEFLTNVVSSVQRVPKLLECTQETLLNSFMTMASLKLMPSAVSGEAYVLPYENKKKGVMEAQFQLGYQGLVTLLYRAGIKSIVAEIVRAGDRFTLTNGKVHHEVDIFSERGVPTAAYVILTLPSGETIEKAMAKKEILEIAERFSKSYGGFGPWDPKQDPQGWMWRKTVLKQAAKLAPKNPELSKAIAEDNKDSVIGDRVEAPRAISAPKDWSKEAELLRSCKTVEALEMLYADLPVEGKIALKTVFEEMKAMLITEAKDIV